MAEEKIRAFVAIELPDDIRAKLVELEDKLKAAGIKSVRWVNPAGIHLTLKFLGDIEPSRVAGITAVIENSASGVTPFSIEVKETGVFPNPQRTRVAWVGLVGDLEHLKSLQERIETNLVPLGFPAEARGFTPHLTLARVNDQASPDERLQFGQLVTGTRFEGGTIHVESVNLMRSQLYRSGAVYTRLSEIRLKI